MSWLFKKKKKAEALQGTIEAQVADIFEVGIT